jgi:bacteriocin biosynthesis cyclodehydratase domain-containing protein
MLVGRSGFGSSWEVEIIDEEHVLLLGERETRLLTGTAYVALASGLEQGRSMEEIVTDGAAKVTAAEIFYVLNRLRTLGVVRDIDEESEPSMQGFWDSLGVDATAARKRLSGSKVTLRAVGDGVSTEPLAESLAAIGIPLENDGAFFVVLTDDYLRPDLASANQKFLRDGLPWLLARTTGSILWLGPLLRPGKSGCWECMADRLRTHRQAETYVQRIRHTSHPRLLANYSLPSTELTAASLLATEIAKSLVRAPGCQLEDVLITFDLATFAMTRHTVVRRPQCPACGDAASVSFCAPEPIRLVNRAKMFSADGGHRDSSPEQTLARYRHHISPLTGVVRELTMPIGTDPVAPMYLSGPNAAAAGNTIHSLRQHFRANTAGKGKTDSQARASALCEAIERHSGIFQGNEYRIRASYESIRGAIHPNTCTNYSAAQYTHRHEEPANRFARVPLPFDECAEIDWSPLWSLTEETFKYLPTAYCYFEYKAPDAERFCWSDSNGCAAGNSPEEAILQGFLELAERDSVALWWYNQVVRPAVDLRSFDDPYFAALTQYYRSLNRDLWVLDITTDLAIPSFVAISRRIDVAAEDIIFGFGAHLDAKLGILRALTEMNQFLPAIMERQTDPSAGYRVSDEDLRNWLQTSTLANRPFLAPAGPLTISATDYPDLQFSDLKEEVEYCVGIAARLGMETLVLDQTRPDIGLPVFRVVVPGLRHFWPRFAPGRLYDIPVALGWLESPVPEDRLNPIVVSF